ncbi:MAG TPA: hypothetical protein PKE29_17040 [Phycisphaerales bacterium]|nr:hypothetical protein [Phycisphaerales bacterium]
MSSIPPTPPKPLGPTPPASLSPTPGASTPGGFQSRSGMGGMGGQPRFDKRISRPTLHPRRVIGGYRLQSRPPTAAPGQAAPQPIVPNPDVSTAEEQPAPQGGWTWASARWMRPVEQLAHGEQLAEGLEYARAGQTRSIDVKPGLISARVQGRMPQAYKTSVRLPTFTPEQWEKVCAAMSSQAKYAAALLAGELPPNIEDLFAPAGLALFPAGAADLSVSCECDVFTGKPHDFGPGDPSLAAAEAREAAPRKKPGKSGVPWCKHVCCLMYLVADKLGANPMTVFMLRGMPEQDLLERLRQARALQGLQRTAAGSVPVYTPHVAGVATTSVPLADTLMHFWTADEPDALDSLDMPIAPPEVSHPLLRRVGPTPFAGAKFPITGLLATCYDVISEAMIREAEGPKEPLA